MFLGRRLVIATKHKKEKVIAPILTKELGVDCFVLPDFDSDILGTFSGEISRELDPIKTVREKCLLAMEAANCDLGVASEGSFGSHPTLFFVPADDEFMIFIDKKNDLEIIARKLSTETNFDGNEINNWEELIEFANKTQFPSHGLILRKSSTDISTIIKDIKDWVKLKEAFENLHQKNGTIHAETDMRAMNNPSRMKVIEKVAKELVMKIKTECPNCRIPGFSVTDVKKGLPCKLCGLPTNSTLSVVYGCVKCTFKKETFFPNEKKTEDPMYCNYCNP